MSIPLSVKTVALNYTITFTVTGTNSTVTGIIDQSLPKGTKITVSDRNVLHLMNLAITVEPNQVTLLPITTSTSDITGMTRMLLRIKTGADLLYNRYKYNCLKTK